ncbi:MAG: calcium/sodium antiporter [Bacteroides sp.]|nr:calcium/sodium antiporter [Bacteroides sp.]MCM1379470.1 calcium/sodium antiporter [Bacteroides sp.]MCM1445927.1 calcium/sodium antiporter [Prevotella sp.]
MDIILLLAGFAMILGGANYMTDGSAAIAKRLGVSDFVVGLTIVSIGTSAPELVVSLIAALEGAPSMSIGNIVGSNIFNILMIIGVVAIIKPIKIPGTILTGDAVWMLLSSAAVFIVGLSPELGAGPRMLTRVSALLFLMFFVLFLQNTLRNAKQPEPTKSADDTPVEKVKELPLWKSLLFLIGGLVVLVLGGEWFVDGATGIARAIGWSEGLIGLTILAVGTSLPEFAASVAAALKGLPGLSVGTVIGSCIFNVFFVLGLAGSIAPMAFGNIGVADVSVMLLAAMLFMLFGFVYGHRTIKRAEGFILVAVFVAYMLYLFLNLK